jgi:signal peptidase I
LNIDFPLILLILVCATGIIWLFDTLLAAKPRQRMLAQLQADYPNWHNSAHPDSTHFAEQVKRRAHEPVIVEYARSFFPVLAVVFVLRSFLFEPFQIPSSSMVPTLQVGDYILVNKYRYGLRFPVLRSKFLDIGEPSRGDVMVFFPPHMNDTYYIKRVIGLPGDVIRYQNKQLSINGEPAPIEWEAPLFSAEARTRVGTEDFGSGVTHRMQINERRPSQDFEVRVKPGHYFMMGDNRDNSSDSRVWGQVPEKDIVGEAVAVWMHWESFMSIPSFHRIGTID